MKKRILPFLICTFLISLTASSQQITTDSSFGSNGILTILVGNDAANLRRIGGQSNGKIIVPYVSSDEFGYLNQGIVTRSTANGALDASFGNGGYRYIDYGHYPLSIIATAIQPDDKILVLYRRAPRDETFDSLRLERWLPDGGIDSSFNHTGLLAIVGEPGTIGGKQIAVKPDGHIILSYYRNNVQYYTQLNPNGRTDMSFGINGSIIGNSLYNQNPVGLLALPDNRLVIANQYQSGSLYYNNLYIYTRSGQPDTTSGNKGLILISDKISNTSGNVDMKSFNYKLYVYTEGNNQDLLIRYNQNGTPDASFGNNGKVYSITTKGFTTKSLDIQPNGKIITSLTGAAGYKRYNTNGSLDSTFGINGYFAAGSGLGGYNFRLIKNRMFIATQFFNNDFLADIHLGAFKFESLSVNKMAAMTNSIQVQMKTSVYPNPVVNTLNISGLTGNSLHQLSLTTTGGRTVATATTASSSYKFSVGALAKGVYYLNVIDNKTRSAIFIVVKE